MNVHFFQIRLNIVIFSCYKGLNLTITLPRFHIHSSAPYTIYFSRSLQMRRSLPVQQYRLMLPCAAFVSAIIFESSNHSWNTPVRKCIKMICNFVAKHAGRRGRKLAEGCRRGREARRERGHEAGRGPRAKLAFFKRNSEKFHRNFGNF